MKLILVGAVLALASTTAGCDLPNANASRVLEVRCVHDTSLDADQRCAEIERPRSVWATVIPAENQAPRFFESR